MPPTLSQRIAEQQRGVASPVMYQRWTDLLFLHWKWDAAALERLLPAGLTLDLHEGQAWLGVVPFFMQRIRPRFLPPVPWLSWFMELNVRTYVHDAAGRPGVWFFSLDCNQPVAVKLARTFFSLPYFHASMRHTGNAGEGLHYHCRRRGAAAGLHLHWTSAGVPVCAAPGTLEFFLAERYVLFTQTRRGIQAGCVAHSPYPLMPAEVLSAPEEGARPILWNGLAAPDHPPDHVCCSPGVNVRIGPLESGPRSG